MRALWLDQAISKVKSHRSACNRTYQALYNLYMAQQDPDGGDPIPLKLDDPQVQDIMRRKPTWVCLTPEDQHRDTRGVH